jgi:hypothetical protein
MKPVYSVDTPDQARLKIARTEIEAIMQKHDLAGCVMLHTPGMGEFFYSVSPSYSCARVDEQAGMMRLRSKLEDYKGDRIVQEHDRAATANMAASLSDMSTNAASMFASMQRVIDRAFHAEHTAGELRPDPAELKRQ